MVGTRPTVFPSFFHALICFLVSSTVFTGEVVRLMDKEGHSLQGFFNRVEFVLVDGTIKFRVVINPILECENCIMASCHEDYLYEVVSVEKFTYKNYRYHL